MSSKSSIPAPGTLNKFKRNSISKIDAVSIKPPLVNPDKDGGSNHEYRCSFVNSKFQLEELPCSYEVWKKCEGNQVPGRVRNGLESKLHNDFVVIKDKETGLITDVDVLPKTFYSSKAALPDNIADKEDILLKVNSKTGGIEVQQVPAGVTKAVIRRLMDALDTTESISTGDTIKGGFEVANVSGNQVSILYNTAG